LYSRTVQVNLKTFGLSHQMTSRTWGRMRERN